MKIIFFFFAFSLLLSQLKLFSFHEVGNEPWGVDAEIIHIKSNTPENLVQKHHLGQKTCRVMIRFFQQYISPIDGPRSSFCPTSSQYALEAISKFGVFKGLLLGCDRLLRENKEMWVYDRIVQYDECDGHIIERKYDPIR
ncbi:MAG: membrane protein insertion efficiency factor YidD [Chlamydiales bacterium]